MARDSFNEQKNKNVYSTKKKKKKQTTKTVVKKPQSSSVSKETKQEQRITQKTYGQPTKPAYKNNKAKTSNEQRKQNTEDNNRLKQTVARQSRERTADTSREMMAQRSNATTTAAQRQKMGVQTKADEQAARDRRRQLGNSIKSSVRDSMSEDNRSFAQRQKSGTMTAQDEERVKKASERRKEVARNTGAAVKKATLDTVSGYGQTLADVDEMAKSNRNWTTAKAQKMGIDLNDKARVSKVEQERQQSIREAREFQQELFDKQEQRQAEWDERTKNAKGLEKAWYGAVESGTGMLLDTAVGAATGTGQFGSLASMGLRTYGSSANQARKEGATDKEARLYGLASAGKEIGTELMFQGAGLAKAAYGKTGLSLADKSANILTKGLTGLKADAVGAGVRALGGTAEENVEELAGWMADPIIKELTYGKNVRNRMKENLRANIPQIGSDADAANVASYFSTPQFTDELTSEYVKSGLSKEQASELAAEMRDYYVAYYSGDNAKLDALETDLAAKLSGQDKLSTKSWSMDELKDTFASTTLLTLATGIPGAVNTSVKGNRIFDSDEVKAVFGDDAVRKVADAVKNTSDKEMSLKAETMKDRLDSGKDLTGTQKYDLYQGYLDKVNETAKKAKASYGVVENAREEQDLVPTMGRDRTGNTVYAKATQREFNEKFASTELTVEALKSYMESDNSISDDESRRANAVKKAVADIHVGGLTVGDAHEFAYGNTLAREALKAEEGIDLDQYIVRNADGTVDLSATNEATENALFQMNADNAIKAAQVETEVFKDDYRGDIDRDVMSRFGNNGQAIWKEVNKDLDPRDLQNYLTTANAASYFYSAGRNTDMGVDEAVNRYADTFKTVDNSVLKRAYAAGARDRIIANTPGYGQTVETGSNIQLKKTKPIITGQLIMDKDVVIPDSDQSAYLALAMSTNTNIHIVSSLKSKQGVEINGMSHGNDIYLNMNAAAESNLGYVFMHEMTHQIKQYAPNEYLALENLVRDRWFNKDQKGMQKAIKDRIDLYLTKGGQQLTEEEAVEEIIADAMAEAMDDPDFAAQVCEEDINLGQAILNSIREALRSIRNMFANNEFRNERFHNSLLSYLGILDEAEKMWLDALATARQNKANGLIADWQDRANKQNSPRLSVSDEELERIKAKKRTNKRDREILRDAGEKLKENDFYNLYTAHIINLGGKGKNADQMVESIKENGFKGSGGFGVNLVDSRINNISRQTEEEIRADLAQYGIPEDRIEAKISQLKETTSGPNRWIDGAYYEGINATVDRYGGRKGQTVMFVPEHHTTNDRSLVEIGFKPYDYEVVKVERDFQPYYELYSKAYDDAHEGRYSITPQQDADYMQAVESNDMETAQRMVDEAAATAMPHTKLKGRWYHGTENEFTVFNFSQGGKNGTADGYGIYLTNDPKVAESYGQRMIEGYVNVERPASGLTSQTLTDIELHRLISRTVDVEAETLMYDEGYDNAGDAKKDTWISNYTNTYEASSLDQAIDDVIKTITQFNGNDFDIIQEIMNGMGIRDYEQATAFYDILTEETGIDGLETKWGDESEMADPNAPTIALAFKSEQIKDASPVTYDDDGKPIPLSERFNTENEDIRYSLTPEQQRDADYMAAVNSGNMDEAQRLVDEAAKEAGYTTKAYHGTGNRFTVFDKEKSGKNYRGYSKYGKGLYFADSIEQANHWGKNRNLLETYLDLKNPYVVPLVAKEGDILLEEYNKHKTAQDTRLKPSKEEPGAFLFEMLNGMTDDKGFTTKFLQERGYDGVIAEHVAMADMPAWTEYVVFEPEQIKSADPVTYAEDGSVIPLSERFDPTNNDIRYSLPTQDSDGNILTDGQMDYFKNSQARDAEGKMQVVYHTTNMGGFTIFDPSYSDDKRSLFFASNWNVSQTYGRNANKPIDIYNDINSASANTLIDRVNNTTAWNIDRIATEEDFKNEIKRVTLSDDDAKKYGLSKDRVEKSKEYVRTLKDMLERMRSGEDFFYSEYNSIGHSYGANSLIATKQEVIDLIQSYGKGTQGYYSCYLNLENPLIVDAKGANWNRISYDPYGNETAGITVQDAIEQIESADIADYGIKNIDVEFEYNDDGFPIAVSYDIGLLGIPDEEHWEWTNYVESDSFEPNVEEYTDNDVLDNAELGIAMWTWVEDKLRNYVSDGMIDMMEQTNIDVNGELHYESFNKTGYDFIRGGNIVDVSEFTDNIDDASGKEYTVNTRDLAEIAENYGHDGVIIRNLMDIGGASSLKGGQALSDIFIAFSSNQVKDINNQNPTENPDIRYSIATRDEVSGYLMQNAESITDIPLQDARLEDNRIRYSLDATDFENSIVSEWDRRKRNLAEDVKDTPLRRSLIRLMKQVRTDSGEDKQYSTETIDETIRSLKKMYYYAKGDKAKDFAREAWDTAERIVGDINYNDVQYLHYKGISSYFADTEIHVPEELIDDDTFIQFAKTNAGRIRLFADEGIEIEEAWKSLHDAYPDLFPRAAFVADSPVGMLIQMDWVLNQLEPYKEAYTSEEHSKLVEDIANTLCSIVEEGNEYNATVNDLNVRAMRQRHSEALRKVQEQEKQKRDNQKERAEKWKQKYLERVEKNKADKEAGKQKKNEAKLVGDIEKNIKWLSDRLRPETRTKDNAIPEQFRSALGALLAEFDLQSKGSKKIEKKKGYPSKTTLKLKQLRDQYAAIAKENDDDGNNVFRYNGDLLVKMDELIKTMESLDKFFDKRYGREVTIADLSLSEMFVIDTMLKSLVHEFREYKNVTINSKRAEIADVSSEVIGDMDTQIGRHGAAREGGALGKINGLLNMAEVTPIYFFKRLGAMYKMYRELRKGFDKYIENDREVIKRLSEIMSGYYNKKNPGTTIESWRTTEDAQTFNFEHGPVTLSVAQMMEVYLYANRPQAFGHMIGDGIIVTPISPVGKIETAKEKLLGHEPMVDPVRLTYENVQEIISKLSEEQVDMANKLQELVAGYMSDLGNETTMKLYGYKMFDDPNYFGIHVSQTATNSSVDAPAITETIKNFGWTKPLTPGAKNTIVIGDIFTDVARYCNEMNQFNAYAVPVSDFMRVYNYTLRDENGELQGSAKSAIIKAFGKQAHTYIMNFLRDLNGSSMRRNGGLEGMIDAALGRAKKAAVFMNMRVALQQPTAIVRALAQVNARYFVGVRPSAAATKEMIEHCPIAQWKAWGFYDTHFGRDVEDLIMNNWSKADVVGSWIYGALDNMTWGMIWQAVKNEVDADIKKRGLDIKKGSQEYWDMCNDRASEVFDSTQVVDSPFHRSDAMRSKDTLVKQFTSFQAEPTLSFNVIRDFAVQAYDAVADGDKTKAAKLIAKGVEVWTLQAAVVAVAQSLWDAVRHKDPDGDDDEDEGFLQLWWQNFMADFVDDLKFYNNIYFLKEFTPYAEKLVKYMNTGKWDTYDSNKLLMFQGAEKMTQGLQQLIKKIQKGDEYKHKNGEPYTWYEVMTNFLGGVGYLTGMPIGTVMRDAQSILKWFHINAFAADGSEKTDKRLADAIAEKMGYQKAGSSSDNVASEATPKKAEPDKDESADNQADIEQKVADYRESLSDNFTDEEKDELVKQYEKRIKKGVKSEEVADRDKDTMLFDAEKAAAGYEGTERDKRIWQSVSQGYKAHVESGDYAYIARMRSVVEQAGGNLDYFDEQIVKASKTALKKTIEPGGADTESEMVAQQNIRYYLQGHGVTQEEISSEIVYKCAAAKDLKVAFRINDEQAITESSYPLLFAGLTTTDYEKIYTNRNRMDLSKYDGKYKDRLKSTGTFVWPTQGTITSHFGARNAPTRGASSNHPAIDIGAPKGTPVVAADGGVVIYAGTNGGYGNSVGIKHDNGMVTYYNHLSAWNVNVGDTVAQGQQIAAVGSTGISTGPHLDFKVLDTNNKPVDPEKYLNSKYF